MPSKNRITLGVVLIAILIGVALVANDASRLLALVSVLALPLLFAVAQRSPAFILKAMLLVVFFIPFSYYDFLNPFKLLNPLVILGCVLGIRLSKRARLTAVDRFYFIFLLSAAVSSVHAISILGSLNWIFYSVTTGYVAYRALVSLDHYEAEGVLKFAVVAGSLSALYGIGEYLAGASLIFGSFIQGRLTSLLGHPVCNGLVFAMVFVLSLALFMETRKNIFIATSAILFSTVILTFARGSWLALAAGLLVMFGALRFQLKFKLFMMVLLLAVSLGLVPSVVDSVVKRARKSEADYHSSFNVRRQSFPIAFSIIRDKPFFGGGPFNAIRYKEGYAVDLVQKKTSFENSYLDLMVDMGLVGLGILVLFVLSILKVILFVPWKDDPAAIYRAASFAGLVICLLNMATFNFDSYRLFHFIVWFVIGLNVVFSIHPSTTESHA